MDFITFKRNDLGCYDAIDPNARTTEELQAMSLEETMAYFNRASFYGNVQAIRIAKRHGGWVIMVHSPNTAKFEVLNHVYANLKSAQYAANRDYNPNYTWADDEAASAFYKV